MWEGRVRRSELLPIVRHAARGPSTGADHFAGSRHPRGCRARCQSRRGPKFFERSTDVSAPADRCESTRDETSAEEAPDLTAGACRNRRHLPRSRWSRSSRLRQHPRRLERRTQPDNAGVDEQHDAVDTACTDDNRRANDNEPAGVDHNHRAVHGHRGPRNDGRAIDTDHGCPTDVTSRQFCGDSTGRLRGTRPITNTDWPNGGRTRLSIDRVNGTTRRS